MSISQANIDQLRRAVLTSLRDHWQFYLIEGFILVILGAAAVVVSPIASITLAILIGSLFLISGVVGLFTTFQTRGVPGFRWSLLSATLAIVAGVLLIGNPIAGALSLTVLLIAFFIIEGTLSVMFALDHSSELPGTWGWMLTSGIIDLILAIIILVGLPGTAAWALGFVIGINLAFGGLAMILMALEARKIEPNAVTAPA